MSFESGARAALRSAIRERDAVADRVEASKAALDRIDTQLHEHWKKLREVRERAGEEERERVERIVAGGSAVLERGNRVREADIESEISAVKEARDLVRGELAEAARSLDFKRRRVSDAVGAVLAGLAGREIAKAEALKREFEGQTAILRFLRSSLNDGQRLRIDEVTGYPLDFDFREHAALAPWRAAADRLTHEADAKLPE